MIARALMGPLAATLALLASAAVAFDGVYGDCAGTGDRVPVQVQGDVIRFYESECRMTNPVMVRDMAGAVLFDFACQGEGETWTERAFVQRMQDGGLILVWRGFASELPLCR
jgi:hypothetical protein